MMNAQNEHEIIPDQHYTVLKLNDPELVKKKFSELSKSVNDLAAPYSEDGSYAIAISNLPAGLGAMAATHHLDLSLTMDDIGRPFLNFGERGLVRETEAGLRKLGP